MTIEEIPVSEETPVRYIADLRQSAFFWYSYNREFAKGRRQDVSVVNPLYQIEHITIYLWLMFVVILITGIVIGTVFTPPALQLLWLPGYILLLFTSIFSPYYLVDRYGDYFNRRMSQRFLREGTIIQGELTQCTVSASTNFRPIGSTLVLKIAYRFESRFGERINGYFIEPRKDLEGRQLPSLGTPVYILYFNDDEHYLL